MDPHSEVETPDCVTERQEHGGSQLAERERNRKEVFCVSGLRSLPQPFLGQNALGALLFYKMPRRVCCWLKRASNRSWAFASLVSSLALKVAPRAGQRRSFLPCSCPASACSSAIRARTSAVLRRRAQLEALFPLSLVFGECGVEFFS